MYGGTGMPDRIGKYEIRGEIGQGGFGKVYCGFDPTVGRLVAIKVLSSGGDPSLLARFRTEATAAGNLNHKNIVTVFEFGEDRGTFFLVMEYLEGRDLQHVMPEANTLKLVDKMNIMSQVAEGLQCAHQHGIVHRDVKPANIMLLADGTVKIMDFGIARLTHANSARLTQSGYLIGTLSYMAPELLNGMEADALCDIWAFGTIYYEFLCGQHPFEATDAAAAMYKIMSAEPRRIKSVFPDCPEALDNVIFRLLAKDRESRYQSLEDVLFDTAPIRLELETQQAGRLVSQAQDLINRGKLEEAEPLIRRILALDPLHQEGRALRKELQHGLKTRSIQTRVHSLSEQSEKFAAVNNLADAIRTLEAALAIDTGNVSLSARLKELQAAKERFELSQQLLARARADFEQNNLTAAFQAANDALHAAPGVEPGNSEARNLLGEVRQRMTARDAEQRLREGLSKVKGLIALQSFDEAIAVIESLAREGTDSAELRDLLLRTRQQSEEHRHEIQIRSEIESAKDAIKNRRFEEAIARLGPLANEPACKGEVAGLLTYASEELALAQRAAKIKSLGKEAWALLKAKDYDAAFARVEGGLQTFPDEGMLLKLRQAILSERAQEERRTAIRQALEESAALDRGGRWEQATAPLEKALWQYPDEVSLRTALDQAKKKIDERKQAERLSALENDLRQAHRFLDQGQPGSATQLLQHLTVSYPGEAAVVSLLDRARADEQRRSALEALTAEVRRSLQGGRPEEALEAIARGRKQLGRDTQFLALEAEAGKARARKDGLEQARQSVRARNWTLAEQALEAILAQDGNDAEARGLLDEVQKERRAEQREQLRDSGRKEAAKLLQSNRFDDAVRSLRALSEQFPEDAAIRDDLRGAVDAKERQVRREAYAQGRQQADVLLREGKFDAAIAAIKKLLGQFPEDAALREDLQAAAEAKLQQERWSRYNSERQRAAELIRNRQFDEAIQALDAMRQQFPGDSGIEEDLRSAWAAQGLQTERFQVNERVAKLEQYYRQGKPQLVKELAEEVLAKIEEPRARELLDWAEATLARPPSGIQPGIPPAQSSRNRYLLGAGLAVILLVAIGIVLKFAGGRKVENTTTAAVVSPATPAGGSTTPAPPQPESRPAPPPPDATTPPSGGVAAKLTPEPRTTAKLTLDQDQVLFDWQIGSAAPGPKTVTVHATGSTQKWQVAANKVDNWIFVTPRDGSFSVGVTPAKLGPGSYSSFVSVTLEQRTENVTVRLTVTAPPSDKGKSPTPGDVGAAKGGAVPVPASRTPQVPVSRDCGANYSGRNTGTLTWIGSLKNNDILWLTRDDTPFEGGGTIKEARGLPGCEIMVELTAGIKVEEAPSAQNHFGWIKLRNVSGATVDTVTLRWTKTK